MKKLRFYSVVFTFALLIIPMLQSCLNDDDENRGTRFTIGTIEVIGEKEYFFNLDDGDKMYPSDTTYIHNYTVENNQRVFIHFLPLEEDIPGYDYSFSGLKTSFLYSLREWMKEEPDFVEHHKTDLAASLEKTIVDILMDKLRKVVKDTGIKEVAVAGGVSANNGLRNAFREHAKKYGWNIFIPKFGYTTDNAAMIAITGYYKFLDKDFCTIDKPAYSRVTIK